MGDTNSQELLKAIEVFKQKYGVYEPLDMFRLDDIIAGLRTEATKTKNKKGKK
jgi:hypothetical protein